jgi:hypothetical protein
LIASFFGLFLSVRRQAGWSSLDAGTVDFRNRGGFRGGRREPFLFGIDDGEVRGERESERESFFFQFKNSERIHFCSLFSRMSQIRRRTKKRDKGRTGFFLGLFLGVLRARGVEDRGKSGCC